MPHTNNISETTKTYSFGDTDLTNRAYTGHEHLPDYQLINMNGRMYDPITKQMTSPDILDQSTYFTQSYNRYSYGLNNPMSYTDPSGYVEIGHRAFWPTPTGTAGGSSIDDWGSWAFMQQMYNYNPMDDYYFMVTNESASGAGTGSILDLIIATGGSSQGDGGQKEGDEGENKASGNKEDSNSSFVVGSSFDATLTVGTGYSGEAGWFLMDGKKGSQFISRGQAFGFEGSLGYNLILVNPKSNFEFGDLEGMGASYTFNYSIFSVSFFGNSTHDCPSNSIFDSYSGVKIGIGSGIGFSSVPTGLTTFQNWMPSGFSNIDWLSFRWH